MVTAQPYTHYAARYPGPRDVVLLVDVSDTTLRFDLNTKATLYARANIQEYWVVDISGRRIVVYRQPAAEGYIEIMAYDANEEVASLARPEASELSS